METQNIDDKTKKALEEEKKAEAEFYRHAKKISRHHHNECNCIYCNN